jgi:hypothetical protein
LLARRNNKVFTMAARANAASATKSVRGIRELKSKITAWIRGFPAANQVELAMQRGRWMAGDSRRRRRAARRPNRTGCEAEMDEWRPSRFNPPAVYPVELTS